MFPEVESVALQALVTFGADAKPSRTLQPLTALLPAVTVTFAVYPPFHWVSATEQVTPPDAGGVVVTGGVLVVGGRVVDVGGVVVGGVLVGGVVVAGGVEEPVPPMFTSLHRKYVWSAWLAFQRVSSTRRPV